MIFLIHSDRFKKRFNALPQKLQSKALDRLIIFVDDEFSEILNNHPLNGEYEGCRSINVTGDLRIIYRKVEKDSRRLLTIGTHPQLYE